MNIGRFLVMTLRVKLKRWVQLNNHGSIFLPCFFMMEVQPNFVVWNCHCAGKKGFTHLVNYLKRKFSFSILVLLETLISGACVDRVVKNLKFDEVFREEAEGFAEGIWVLWDIAF